MKTLVLATCWGCTCGAKKGVGWKPQDLKMLDSAVPLLEHSSHLAFIPDSPLDPSFLPLLQQLATPSPACAPSYIATFSPSSCPHRTVRVRALEEMEWRRCWDGAGVG